MDRVIIYSRGILKILPAFFLQVLIQLEDTIVLPTLPSEGK